MSAPQSTSSSRPPQRRERPSETTRKPQGQPSTAANPTPAQQRTSGVLQRLPSRTNTMAQANRPSASLIPFSENDREHRKHRDCYVKAIEFVKQRDPKNKPRILVCTDIEQDYDDLLAVIFLAEMHRLGAVELAGFVANHHPAIERAKFLRTVLHLLGHDSIPVAVGTDGREYPKEHATHFFYGLKNKTFRDARWNRPKQGEREDRLFEPGARLIKRLASEDKAPLTVLLISSLQDIGEFFEAHRERKEDREFLRSKFHKFVSQGGYTVEPVAGSSRVTMKPVEGMMNNDVHLGQARNYTKCLAGLGLPSDAWSRDAAKAARLPGTFMEGLFQYGPIGAHLQWLWKRQEFKFYWDPFNWPHRPFLSSAWYLNTRLGLDKDSAQFKKLLQTGIEFTDAAPMIKVIAYDCCAAVGTVGDDFMIEMGILEKEKIPAYNRASHPHRVFGKSPNDQGGINIPRLVTVMEAFLLGGLMATHKLPINRTPEFQKLVHMPVESRFGVDLFTEKMMPVMKAIMEHDTKADKCEEDAEKARAARNRDEYERMKGAARHERESAESAKKTLCEILRIKDKNRLPTKDDVPYEQLFQVAVGEGRERR